MRSDIRRAGKAAVRCFSVVTGASTLNIYKLQIAFLLYNRFYILKRQKIIGTFKQRCVRIRAGAVCQHNRITVAFAL